MAVSKGSSWLNAAAPRNMWPMVVTLLESQLVRASLKLVLSNIRLPKLVTRDTSHVPTAPYVLAHGAQVLSSHASSACVSLFLLGKQPDVGEHGEQDAEGNVAKTEQRTTHDRTDDQPVEPAPRRVPAMMDAMPTPA